MPNATRMPKAIGPAAIVIFGGAGNVTQRLLAPALGRVVRRPEFTGPRPVPIILVDKIPQPAAIHNLLSDSDISYVQGDVGEVDTMQAVGSILERAESTTGGNCLFVAPFAGDLISRRLEQARLTRADRGWRRMLVDKPIGHNRSSAQEFEDTVRQVWKPDQIFRVDHYGGKPGVRKILRFRQKSGKERDWSRKAIRAVEICFSEHYAVGGRAEFYNQTGATRDMIQSHALQLLSLVAMDLPYGKFEGNALQKAKVAVLNHVRPIAPQDVVFGQYETGTVDGLPQASYREELGRDSSTETYAALCLHVDNDRWRDVPFLIRTGKCLPQKTGYVVVHFREGEDLGDSLVFRIGPDDGLITSNGQEIQLPGDKHAGKGFNGYELPIGQVLRRDRVKTKWLLSSEEILAAWGIIDPVMSAGYPVYGYQAGSPGPLEADRLPREYGLSWTNMN